MDATAWLPDLRKAVKMLSKTAPHQRKTVLDNYFPMFDKHEKERIERSFLVQRSDTYADPWWQ
ncbi:hypothetical protein ACFQWB_07865 [Paenibacillus thermoaerophilus]|uniref:Uncharacterized protein n=1 Tax=Paenibacillus thermoaerophilus TaxID=1215385 RepID=A0ABW2V122_9BACL|nr:hypothetical protein [Paenibacillus thermoaerophilus]TMV18395.1 hypothetical protein FE781_02965 [Paenibacillus thermoaerophilus]